MTYSAFAALTSGKHTVWLYEFTIGGVVTRYTSRSSAYTYDSETWSPAAIGHGRIMQTANLRKQELTITLPKSNAVATTIREGVGIIATRVRVLHGYEEDGDQEFVVKFDGRIVNHKPFVGTTTLICEPESTKRRRKAIAAHFQRPCRHALYHGGCGLSLASYQAAAVATDWTSPILTVTEAAAQPDGYYSGGLVSFNGALQMIRRHTGTSLNMLAPVPGLEADLDANGTSAVLIAPGCDLTMQTCDDKFSNIENFGGFPWVTDTPFDGRNPF